MLRKHKKTWSTPAVAASSSGVSDAVSHNPDEGVDWRILKNEEIARCRDGPGYFEKLKKQQEEMMATFEKKTMKQYLIEKEIEANSKASGAERKLRNKGWAKQVEKDKKKKAATSSALVSFLAWRELSSARFRGFI
jgi:hypothetical protein